MLRLSKGLLESGYGYLKRAEYWILADASGDCVIGVKRENFFINSRIDYKIMESKYRLDM